ncbi:hypothetical protein CKAH01_01974 [Colletotrichum kahawae]|uniref:Uncharacterized protein n=1 Tax=Colletotrichum kahawae TaxID=34407 RepID=A0AAE0CZW1_COLKA|nr:hypothetical protein CKAH01_01974 [Colletotrichum kahawae]
MRLQHDGDTRWESPGFRAVQSGMLRTGWDGYVVVGMSFPDDHVLENWDEAGRDPSPGAMVLWFRDSSHAWLGAGMLLANKPPGPLITSSSMGRASFVSLISGLQAQQRPKGPSGDGARLPSD